MILHQLVLAQAEDLGGSVNEVIEAFGSGRAILIAAAVITLLVQVFKSPMLGGLTDKIPAEYRAVIPVVLGGVAGMLYSVIAGTPWWEAVYFSIFAGGTAILNHQAVVKLFKVWLSKDEIVR